MKRIALALLLSLAMAASAVAQSFPTPQTNAQIPIVGTATGTPVKIVSGQTGRQIIVTAVSLIPAATSVVQFTYGTGTNCGTGTQNVTGAMTFSGNQELNLGDGSGGVWVLPQATDLCITITTAAAPGSLAYAMFAQ